MYRVEKKFYHVHPEATYPCFRKKPKLPPILKKTHSQKEESGIDIEFPCHHRSNSDVTLPQVHNRYKTFLILHRSMLINKTKAEVKSIQGKLLSELPILNKKQIRRTRTTRPKSILLDLEEAGFKKSAGYLKKLLEYEKDVRSDPENIGESNNWPWLYQNNTYLEIISGSLKEAEVAQRFKKYNLEIAVWFRLSIFFGRRKQCWYWIAYAFFQKTLRKVHRLKNVRLRRKAIVCFTLGQFFLEKVALLNDALKLFSCVNVLTEKQKKLSCVDYFSLNEYVEHSLHHQACFYLAKTLLKLAVKSREEGDTKGYGNLCQRAVIYSGKALKSPQHEKILLEMAKSIMESHNYMAAEQKLQMVQVLCKQSRQTELFCEALLAKTQCYIFLKKYKQAYNSAMELCDYAMTHSNEVYSLIGGLEIAELLLSLGIKNEPGNYMPTLKQATNAYNLASYVTDKYKSDISKHFELRARFLVGCAEGQSIMSEYMNLIKRSGTNRQDYNKLLAWYFSRVPFVKNQIKAYSISVPENGISLTIPIKNQIQSFTLFANNLTETTLGQSDFSIGSQIDATNKLFLS